MSVQLKSKIRICKDIKLDKDYNNVLNYTEQQMLSLCESQDHLVAFADDYSFIRNKGVISTKFKYDDALKCNYMAFQNKDYANKWFFAFIDEVIYVGENNTEIRYTIDAWSTYFNTLTIKPSFVVREHTNDDTIGLNTIPENLDIGEVIEEVETEDESYGNTTYWIGVYSDWDIPNGSNSGGKQYAGISVYDNVVSGSNLYLFQINSLSSFTDLALFLLRTNGDSHIADIKNIFVIPNLAIPNSQLQQRTATIESGTFTFYTLADNITPTTFDTTISKLYNFSGINIKNNKCFVYPYNYLFVSNNNGSNNIFKYEDFSSNDCVFENQFVISIGGSGRLVPKNYKGMITADDEALATGKYPTCGWSSDAFTNWLTQNSVNIAVSVGMAAGSIAAGALTAGASAFMNTGSAALNLATQTSQLASGTMSVAGSVGGLIGQFRQASLLPNISGGQATGDVIWGVNKNKFTFRQMRVKNEYLKIIDDYFTRFGYKTNRLKVPNITGRQYWNYIEISSNDDLGYGSVPNNFMITINNIARRGVTIWHSHANIGNYNLNNSII